MYEGERKPPLPLHVKHQVSTVHKLNHEEQPETGDKVGHVNVRRKEGNVLFNDALDTFYLRLYGVRYIVKDHSDRERGNLLLALHVKHQVSAIDKLNHEKQPETGDKVGHVNE